MMSSETNSGSSQQGCTFWAHTTLATCVQSVPISCLLPQRLAGVSVSPPVPPLLLRAHSPGPPQVTFSSSAQVQHHIHQRNIHLPQLTAAPFFSCLPVCNTQFWGFCGILDQRAGSFGPESADWIFGLLLTTGTDHLEQNQLNDYGTILSYFLCYQFFWY